MVLPSAPLALLAAALLAPSTHAYRRYLNGLPSSDGRVPCPTGSDGAGCWGTGYCEAYGHNGCWTGGVHASEGSAGGAAASRKGGIETAFGRNAEKGWSLALCNADDDGDGFTNGDELGDGCCAWPLAALPTATVLGNPSFSLVVPQGSASCTRGALPPPPGNVTATAVPAGGALRVTWAPAGAAVARAASTPACVCEWRLSLAYFPGLSAPPAPGSAAAAAATPVPILTTFVPNSGGPGAAGGPAVLCLPAGLPSVSGRIALSIAVAGLHRGGTGGAATLNMSLPYAGAAASGVPASGVGACTPALAAPATMNLAGTPAAASTVKALMSPPAPATLGVLWVALALGVPLALPAALLTWWARDPTSALRRVGVHTYLPRRCAACTRPRPRRGSSSSENDAKGRAPPAAATGTAAARVAAALWGDLAQSGAWHTGAIALAALGLAAAAAQTWRYYAWMYFPLGTGFPVGRALGYAAAIALGLQLLPVARFSLWTQACGVPFERALTLHRWAGWMAFVLTWAHGIWLLVGYCLPAQTGSLYPPSYVLAWSAADAVNPLAGLLSGVCVAVLSLTSLAVVRRRAYSAFLAAHALWIPAIALAWIHIAGSDTPLWPVVAPGLVLLAADWLLLGLDLFLLRECVVVDAGVCFGNGLALACSEIRASAGDPALVQVAGRSLHGAGGSGAAPPGITGDAASQLLAASGEPVAAFLIIDKLPAAALGPRTWPFRHAPGQYVYISVAAGGWLPHPVSVSSVADPRPLDGGGAPGRFAVTIKGDPLKPRTWSGRVVCAALAAVQVRVGETRSSGGAAAGGSGRFSGSSTGAGAMPAPVLRTVAGAGVGVGSVDSGACVEAGAAELGGGHAWPTPSGGALLPASSVEASAAELAAIPIPLPARAALRVRATGPFGRASLQLARYRHFALLAGGVGVTPIAPLHHALVQGLPVEEEHARGNQGVASGILTLSTTWTLRDAGLAAAFAPLLAPGPAAPTATAQVHLTSAAATAAANPAAHTSAPAALPPWLAVERGGRRPDVRAVLAAAAARAIEAERRAAGASTGAAAPALRGSAVPLASSPAPPPAARSTIAVAVVVCGPEALVLDAIAAAQELSGSGAAATAGGASVDSDGVRVLFDVHRETFHM